MREGYGAAQRLIKAPMDARALSAHIDGMGQPDNEAEKRRRARIKEAGERALAEAEARRRAGDIAAQPLPPEKGGPSGPEPTRYGDWEKNGITSDF